MLMNKAFADFYKLIELFIQINVNLQSKFTE